MDYSEREGIGAAIPVMVEKNRLIATPLTVTVTPQVIAGPPANPFAPNLAGMSRDTSEACANDHLYPRTTFKDHLVMSKQQYFCSF